MDIATVEGRLDGSGRRVALVASRFNQRVVEGLVDGAVDCLRRHGVADEDLLLVWVPGAWELPTGLQELAAAGGWDGLVALGAVIRGETPHFDHVCSQASAGVRQVGLEHRLPIGFGLLTCDTTEQARERSGGKAGNKGWEAAQATLEMIDLGRNLRTLSEATSG